MYIKRFLILINLLFICVLKAQSTKEGASTNPIDRLKTEIYKSIILSEEFKSKKKCHIVGVNTVSLKMDYSTGSAIGFYYTNLQIIKDTISVENLRQKLPKKYWIFEDPYKFLGVEYTMDYIYTLKKSDSLYIPKNIDFESSICTNSFDIIKIYEPLDKWMNFYTLYYSEQPIEISEKFKHYEVIIPVKYELLSSALLLEKEKYYLFKIKIGYNDKGELEIIKKVIGSTEEEKKYIVE